MRTIFENWFSVRYIVSRTRNLSIPFGLRNCNAVSRYKTWAKYPIFFVYITNVFTFNLIWFKINFIYFLNIFLYLFLNFKHLFLKYEAEHKQKLTIANAFTYMGVIILILILFIYFIIYFILFYFYFILSCSLILFHSV